ncbi:MAG: phage baseplate protein [Candidatus Methanoperedens sp.]|nr:phage baseplate protein [Candidatus Methanoperedens sp.]
MRPMSAQDILNTWEQGQNQHPLDKALTLLFPSFPDSTKDELATLTIGQRDAFLLSARELVFGGRLNLFARCPQCQERLEFSMSTKDICAVKEPHEPGSIFELAAGDFVLRFRLPDSIDLAETAGCRDVAAARMMLVELCVQQAFHNGTEIPGRELPEEIVGRLSKRMAECDTRAEVLLDLRCPACDHTWQMLFDVVSFFWAEISSHARRLLEEVHTLARAYGWSESDILSMSQRRRQFYLDMVD